MGNSSDQAIILPLFPIPQLHIARFQLILFRRAACRKQGNPGRSPSTAPSSRPSSRTGRTGPKSPRRSGPEGRHRPTSVPRRGLPGEFQRSKRPRSPTRRRRTRSRRRSRTRLEPSSRVRNVFLTCGRENVFLLSCSVWSRPQGGVLALGGAVASVPLPGPRVAGERKLGFGAQADRSFT